MPLITDPVTGVHTFLPDPQSVGQDIDSLLSPRNTRGQVRPLALDAWYDEPIGPSHPGGYYFRLNLREGRGGLIQEGDVFEVCAAMASGDMVFDRDGMARLAHKTGSNVANPPSTFYGDRSYGTTFLDTPLVQVAEVGGVTHHLFKDIGGSATPNLNPVTGFAPPAGASIPYCLEAGQVNDTPALYIGWNGAAVNSLQVLTDLSNPPTSTSVGIGAFPCFGVCQVGIDGNSIQAYTADASGGIVKMFNTNVGFGSATIVSRARLPQGGYTVGMGNIGYNPQVYYVAPKNGQTMLGATYAPIGPGFYGPTFKGTLLAADLRAFEMHDVKTVLDFVLYATLSKYGIFYCNGRQHQHLTQGEDFPVDSMIDWGPNSNRSRICRGHWCIDDRIVWQVNETDGTGATTAYRMEFDTVLKRVRQISKTVTLGTPGAATARLFSMGGPRLPYSEANRNLIDFADDRWYYQHLNRSSELGFNERHTSGAADSTGELFEASATWVTPRFRLKRRPRAKFVVKRVTGPTLRNLREGGTDGYMTVDVTSQPQARFEASESAVNLDRRPVRLFDGNDSWTYELQATMTAYQGTVGTNATRSTGNYGDVTIEGFYFDEVLGDVPSLAKMKGWDAAA